MTEAKNPKRRAALLAAAIKCAESEGVQWITRDQVAKLADCAPGLVNYYWSTMVQLKRDVFREAVRLKLLPLIAQGLADGNAACKAAPEELRRAALECVL